MHPLITIAAAQYPITFHKHLDDWAEHIGRWVGDAVQQGADLLLFPEYGAMELVSLMPEADQSDLQRQVRQMDRLKADFLRVFSHWAAVYRCILVAPSLPVTNSGQCFNRCYVFGPKGLAGYQDKLFMTRFETEEWFIDPGLPQLTVFETDWGAFGIQTCYDVEFPLGSALLCRHGAQLILAPSCTETLRGATRVHVGARARALENQCYVAVSQVVGEAPWSLAVDINYGYTAVYSTPDTGFPETGVLAMAEPQQAGWLLQTLDLSALHHVRANGAVLNARDHARVDYTLGGQTLAVSTVRIGAA